MATLLEYKCPCCGGAIHFDSGKQQMACPYCDTTFDVSTLKAYDEELHNLQPEQMEWNTTAGNQWEIGEEGGLTFYTCQSCGGQVVTDQILAATTCPYCDNPVVVSSRLSGILKPDLIIPFQLDKEAAKQALARHFKGKFLLPKVFRSQNHLDKIKGIYVPFWLFDCDVNAHMSYRGTRLRQWSDSNYRYTETSFFQVIREGGMGFDKVPVDGSQKMPDELMEAIEPFDYSKAVDFQTAYLAGYLADQYDVDAKTSEQRANCRIKNSVEESFRTTVSGFASVTPEASNVQIVKGSSHYALLPVWLLHTTFQGKKYTFAMNGQSGKLVGDLPVAWGRFWGLFAGVFAAVSALVALVLFLM